MVWTESQAQRFASPDFGLDPYFKRVAGRAECGEKHLEHMLRVVWPLLASYRLVIVGQRAMTTYTTIGMFAVGDRDLEHLGAGHVLYVDYPGKGKTLLAGVPAIVLGGTFGHLQGDPEKMPTEYTGNRIRDIDEQGRPCWKFMAGPALCDIQLIDEANRLSPDTMSAFLEVLCQGRITVFGERHSVNPFVIFTMNPIETEGVRKLVEALLDRTMFKVTGEWFTAKQFADILERTNDYKKIRGMLKQVCSINTVHEIREFFHENIYVSREIREKFAGRFAEASNDPRRFELLKDLHRQWNNDKDGGEVIIKSGISGRGIAHWEGAAKVLAAFRYREYATENEFRKLLLPITRHRIKFAPGVLEFFTDKWPDCPDTNATADKIILQLAKEAW
ncbi:MAG: AAA family ATPase [Parcubacteria group bacterium]|nr:AAA family ATPase [Parcubacteria group bacterium]